MQNNSSVRVDGSLLKADRKAAGFTQASFCAECASVSLVTVRRAEQGNRIIRPYLTRMAAVLGRPIERYAIEDDLAAATDYFVTLKGEWTGYYIESDRGILPYLVQEEIVFRQKGALVDGDYSIYCPGEIRSEKLRDGRVINNVLSGMTYPDNWPLPSGMASIVQMVSRSNDWLDGFTSWYDSDLDKIECSRIISVRKSSASYLKFLREARKIMEADLVLFRTRSLMEKGYSFDEAVSMERSVDKAVSEKSGLVTQRSSTASMLRIEGDGYLIRLNISYEKLLERLIELDYESLRIHPKFEKVYEGTAEQWAPIFKDHPDCWRLLTKGDRVVGYWHFLALSPKKMAEARRGELVDSTLSLNDIEELNAHGSYSVYLDMIVCEPKYRFGRSIKILLDSVFEAVELLAIKHVFIDDIVFAAWTQSSVKLAKRFAFSKIGILQTVEGDDMGDTVGIFQARFHDILNTEPLESFNSLRIAYGAKRIYPL